MADAFKLLEYGHGKILSKPTFGTKKDSPFVAASLEFIERVECCLDATQ
ncbi:hypothetical protein [Herpetosiphon llansteffanensis]|nr:hypothetical protein [Herpetosiphon llansteffanensis]